MLSFFKRWSSQTAMMMMVSLGCGTGVVVALLLLKPWRQIKTSKFTIEEKSVTVDDKEQTDCTDAQIDLKHLEIQTTEENVSAVEKECQELLEFEFPTALCGRLVGKNGRNIKALVVKTGANVAVTGNNADDLNCVLRITGSINSITSAVDEINKRFPDATLLNVSRSTQLRIGNSTTKLFCCCLPAIGVSADVIVSHITNADNLYLQIVTDHHIKARQNIATALANTYNKKFKKSPSFPIAPSTNDFVAVPYLKDWYRGKIINYSNDNKTMCDVILLDHGEIVKVPWKTLRTLRDELLRMPFEAIECYLAYVSPPQGEHFPGYANAAVEEWTTHKTVQCVAIGSREDGLPLVELHSIDKKGEISFINRDLVTFGLAIWIESNS